VSRPRASYRGNDPDFHVIRSTFSDDDGPVGRYVDSRARLVLAEMQRRAPVRTGLLLTTLRTQRRRTSHGPAVDVIAGARGLTEYLGFIIFGTEPHIIRARRRRALRFIGSQGLTFARSVRHPGTRANNFMQDSLRVLR
jgi:hypothetical protein